VGVLEHPVVSPPLLTGSLRAASAGGGAGDVSAQGK
jgi:hypothetical protein